MAKGTLRIRVVGDASNLQKTLGNATGSIKKFATRGLAVLGTAAAAAVAGSIKAFADFDQAMTRSTAIMGDVSDVMRGDMADAAREVAKTTVFSAKEAAESYFFLASAGMDAAESIEALPKVAAFAQAGNFDMARATDLLTDAQSALGLAVDDSAQSLENLARVGDVLVKANTLANASVEEFSEALTNKAGAALRQLNKDVEEGVAVLAVYADQGRKGSEAGTILNTTLEGLTRTARTNADAYRDLGVAVFDADGEMRNMADIVGDLEVALDGMTTEQQLAELAALGLTRQARDGVIALLDSSDAIREYEKDLRSAGGAAEDVADKQLQTFWAQLGLVRDNLLDVAISIGEALMPALMGFVDWLQRNLPAITSWFDNVTTKFNDLLGTSETTMQGASREMSEMANSADRAMLGTAESLAAMHVPFGNFENRADTAMLNAAGSVHGFRTEAGEDFDEAGTFMARLSEAWQTVWNEDIKPWFTGTMLPWLEHTFFPAVIDAFARAGSTAASAFVRNLGSGIGSGISAIFKGLGLTGLGHGLADTVQQSSLPSGVKNQFKDPRGRNVGGSGSPASEGPISLPRNVMHDGGIVPGRRGQDVPIIAAGGETILPTHKPGFRANQGTVVNITVEGNLDNVTLDEVRREIGGAFTGLAMAAADR